MLSAIIKKYFYRDNVYIFAYGKGFKKIQDTFTKQTGLLQCQ